jgi:hypothetical protein
MTHILSPPGPRKQVVLGHVPEPEAHKNGSVGNVRLAQVTGTAQSHCAPPSQSRAWRLILRSLECCRSRVSRSSPNNEAHVELALENGVRLATTDEQLRHAARISGIALVAL